MICHREKQIINHQIDKHTGKTINETYSVRINKYDVLFQYVLFHQLYNYNKRFIFNAHSSFVLVFT